MSKESTTKARMPKLVYKEFSNKRWDWFIVAPNGRTITQGTQGQGFSRKENAESNFNSTVDNIKLLITDINGKQFKGNYAVMIDPARVVVVRYVAKKK